MSESAALRQLLTVQCGSVQNQKAWFTPVKTKALFILARDISSESARNFLTEALPQEALSQEVLPEQAAAEEWVPEETYYEEQVYYADEAGNLYEAPYESGY